MKSTKVAFIVIACIVIINAEQGPHDKKVDERKPCLIPCTRHYSPVCGLQGRKSRSFGNECMWKYHNCENEDDVYPEMKQGPCPDNNDSS